MTLVFSCRNLSRSWLKASRTIFFWSYCQLVKEVWIMPNMLQILEQWNLLTQLQNRSSVLVVSVGQCQLRTKTNAVERLNVLHHTSHFKMFARIEMSWSWLFVGGVILRMQIIPQTVSGKLPIGNIYFGSIRNWEGGTEESVHPALCWQLGIYIQHKMGYTWVFKEFDKYRNIATE